VGYQRRAVSSSADYRHGKRSLFGQRQPAANAVRVLTGGSASEYGVLRQGDRDGKLRSVDSVSRSPRHHHRKRIELSEGGTAMKMNRHRKRGGSMAEMALVMVALLSLMFGIIDFGRARYT